jgi:hypothetical protein
MMQITGLMVNSILVCCNGIVAVESATPTTAELLARKKLAPTGWHVPQMVISR